MADTDWCVVEDEIDISESKAKFYNILNGVVKLCIPFCIRHSHINNKLKRWNSQIEAGLLHKKCTHNKYQLSQNENDKIDYERLRRETKIREVSGII